MGGGKKRKKNKPASRSESEKQGVKVLAYFNIPSVEVEDPGQKRVSQGGGEVRGMRKLKGGGRSMG